MTLAADLARAIDPVHLAAAIGMQPDEWQRDVLRSDADRILLNCSRQSGKSTIASILAVRQAIYEPDSLTLLLSPSMRQSAELFRKCLATYKLLGRPVPAQAETALTLQLANGSRIVSLPGQEATIRGYSGVRLLIVDEAARVDDPLYGSVRPMLAVSKGRLVALSTPWGSRGWWWEAWTSRDPWMRVEVPATACPRISPEFLEEEKRTHGEWFYKQEYLCEFLDGEMQAFRRDDIERAFKEGIEQWL